LNYKAHSFKFIRYILYILFRHLFLPDLHAFFNCINEEGKIYSNKYYKRYYKRYYRAYDRSYRAAAKKNSK